MSEFPEWLDSLFTIVSNCVYAHSPMGPLRFRYFKEEENTELLFFPPPIELLGGKEDGAVVSAGFSLNLKELMSAFEQVDDFRWYALPFGPYDSEGPNISIEGIFQGRHVWIRFLAYPPSDEEPELKLDVL